MLIHEHTMESIKLWISLCIPWTIVQDKSEKNRIKKCSYIDKTRQTFQIPSEKKNYETFIVVAQFSYAMKR